MGVGPFQPFAAASQQGYAFDKLRHDNDGFFNELLEPGLAECLPGGPLVRPASSLYLVAGNPSGAGLAPPLSHACSCAMYV
jgi:hypothetical protein